MFEQVNSRRCNQCYWCCHSINDPTCCVFDKDNLWDIIEDYSRAVDCNNYITESEANTVLRKYIYERSKQNR